MDDTGLSSLHILVYGHIHGVGYRKLVKSVADKYGINGYVRNVYDGSVEILAQNESRFMLNRFIDEIKVSGGYGPDVKQINAKYTKADKTFKGFSIAESKRGLF